VLWKLAAAAYWISAFNRAVLGFRSQRKTRQLEEMTHDLGSRRAEVEE
jgi:hypothetical protein